MISKITLKNFQIHKDTVIEFGNGVNVLAGSSDGGKSSIIRALQWVVQNKPNGSLAYRNNKCKKNDVVEVSIEFDDHILSRKRSETINEYTLDGIAFVAMRTDVPEEISSVLNISDINLLNQFDPFYLLSASSGEVSKELNAVCNLSIVDQVIKLAKTYATNNKEQVRIAQDKLKVTETKLNELIHVDQHKIEIDKIEEDYTKLLNLRQNNEHLKLVLDQLCTIDKRLSGYKAVVLYSEQIEKLDRQTQEALSETAILGQLGAFINQFTIIEAKLHKLPKILYTDTFHEIDQRIALYKHNKDMWDNLYTLSKNTNKLDKDMSTQTRDIELLNIELKEIVADIDICPFCDREMIHE